MTVHLPPTVLIIDSDLVSRTASSNALERSGFLVVMADNGTEALRTLDSSSETQKPHIILISLSLTGLSGLEICTVIKTKPSLNKIPVIMIADRSEEIATLRGLENSFDDYLIRPFIPSELVNKIKNQLGKSKPVLRKKIIGAGNIRMDLLSYRVVKNNREIHLGPTEFKILQCFVENPTRIFSRQELMTYVWGNKHDVELRTVDVHINRLRSALSEPGQHIQNIKTVRSAGYCLELPEPVN